MFKVAIDAGHGGKGSTPGKRSPDGEYEWNFNDKVVQAFITELNTYEDVEVKRMDDPSGNTDIPLKTRTDKANAWGANIYLSVHHNANTSKWGSWSGTETFVYTNPGAQAMKLAQLVHAELLKSYGLKDRSIKKADFHIVRETKMPAVLIEGGFMDSTIDIKKLRDNTILSNAGKGAARAVAAYAGLKKRSIKEVKLVVPQTLNKTTTEGTKGLYRVIVDGTNIGAYKQSNNVLSEVEKAIKSGKKKIQLELV